MGRVVDESLTIAHDELELARIELVEKLPALGGDLVRLAVAAVLAAVGLMLGTLAIAWLLADYVFGIQHVWAGFAVLAAVVLIPAAVLASGAIRRARATGPPVPSKALRHARELRSAVRR